MVDFVGMGSSLLECVQFDFIIINEALVRF